MLCMLTLCIKSILHAPNKVTISLPGRALDLPPRGFRRTVRNIRCNRSLPTARIRMTIVNLSSVWSGASHLK